jgi:hypothetical protein
MLIMWLAFQVTAGMHKKTLPPVTDNTIHSETCGTPWAFSTPPVYRGATVYIGWPFAYSFGRSRNNRLPVFQHIGL